MSKTEVFACASITGIIIALGFLFDHLGWYFHV